MNNLKDLSNFDEIDYKKEGLLCGIEIHQQLNTGKLFCSCPCDIQDNSRLEKQVTRKLRFSLGETGEIDRAALEEFKKGKYNVYKFNDEISCLVDLDEEPPSSPNKKAVECAIRLGQMLNLEFFDKIQFMRKLIVDGSITSGFQRTAMLGVSGFIEVGSLRVGITAMNVEEDSCRVLEREHRHSVFALDRQGIPLIELTTDPNMKTPDEVQKVAYKLGSILRSFDDVKRGLGTIRQDLNVSISKGSRIEIKGAQNVKLIPQIVHNEVRRQVVYVSILTELKLRGVDSKNFSDKKIYDITNCFEKTTSKVVLANLKDTTSGVYAIKLKNFKGILGQEMQENFRFATEISDKNKKRFPQIKGLFHSDEMPNYGITENEVESIRKNLKLEGNDSFILIVQDKKVANESLKYVIEIIEEMIQGVTSEVRQVDPKGVKTKFLRYMPGSARMYPETDVPEIDLDSNYLSELSKNLPELYDEKIERLSKEFSIEENKVQSILEEFNENKFKELLDLSKKQASFLYSVLFDIPKDIKKRENVEPVNFTHELYKDIASSINEDNLNLKILRDLFLSLYKDQLDHVDNLKEYLREKGVIGEEIPEDDILEVVKQVIEKNPDAPFGALMGLAMKEFQGKVDGKKISDTLKSMLN